MSEREREREKILKLYAWEKQTYLEKGRMREIINKYGDLELIKRLKKKNLRVKTFPCISRKWKRIFYSICLDTKFFFVACIRLFISACLHRQFLSKEIQQRRYQFRQLRIHSVLFEVPHYQFAPSNLFSLQLPARA